MQEFRNIHQLLYILKVKYGHGSPTITLSQVRLLNEELSIFLHSRQALDFLHLTDHLEVPTLCVCVHVQAYDFLLLTDDLEVPTFKRVSL